jgi:tetratricopeptide (TPR) repeat protein
MSAKTIAKIAKLSQDARDLQRSGRYAEAEGPLKLVIDLAKLVHGAKHPLALQAEVNLAVSYRRRGDVDLALPILQRVLGELSSRFDEPDCAYLYRLGLNNLGAAYLAAGRLEEAGAALELCLNLVELALPLEEDAKEEHARVLDNLADVLCQRGDLDTAEVRARAALAAWLDLRGEGHLDTGIAMSQLGAVLMGKGDLDAARPLVERSLALARTLAGEEHPEVCSVLNLLGTLEVHSGDLDRASELFARSATLATKVLSESHPRALEAMEGLEVVARLREGVN